MISPQNIWGMVDIGVWSFGRPKIMESEEMQRGVPSAPWWQGPNHGRLEGNVILDLDSGAHGSEDARMALIGLQIGNNCSAVIAGVKAPKAAANDLQDAVMKIMHKSGILRIARAPLVSRLSFSPT